jgi:hypothetical protein
VSICSDDDTYSTESDSKYDSELDPDVFMHVEDDVDAPYGVDFDGDLEMGMHGDNELEEDEDKEDEKEEKEVDEDEKEDKNEEEDKDEDDGKEAQMIGQGEMVNTSADDVYTMVDYQAILLPEQGQEMCKHTPRPQPLVPAPWPHTP